MGALPIPLSLEILSRVKAIHNIKIKKTYFKEEKMNGKVKLWKKATFDKS